MGAACCSDSAKDKGSDAELIKQSIPLAPAIPVGAFSSEPPQRIEIALEKGHDHVA